MDLDTVRTAYSRWARVYDVVFGPLFTRARRRAIAMLELRPGQRLAEIGVGTGLSLPHVPEHCTVSGIDISRPMLERAIARCRVPGQGLVEGDAARLPYADATFDAAMATYVVSAVPDAAATLREIARVCRPGAHVVLLNHVVSDNGVVAAIERAITPITEHLLGFHADFDMTPSLSLSGLAVEGSERVPPLRYWTATRCRVPERRGAPS